MLKKAAIGLNQARPDAASIMQASDKLEKRAALCNVIR
jgi:hypothetical protein